MTTDDHAINKAAYEKCGYIVHEHDGVCHHKNDNLICVPLAPWSNADAAIAHAERGGFRWSLAAGPNDKDNGHGGYTIGYVRKWDEFDNSVGSDANPGIALRNAIAAYVAEGGEG
jgi:hypothetical protein